MLKIHCKSIYYFHILQIKTSIFYQQELHFVLTLVKFLEEKQSKSE